MLFICIWNTVLKHLSSSPQTNTKLKPCMNHKRKLALVVWKPISSSKRSNFFWFCCKCTMCTNVWFTSLDIALFLVMMNFPDRYILDQIRSRTQALLDRGLCGIVTVCAHWPQVERMFHFNSWKWKLIVSCFHRLSNAVRRSFFIWFSFKGTWKTILLYEG